jgi:hypothetical protein
LAQRIVSGEKAPILDTPQRTAYAWNVVKAMPEMFAQPPATVRHRIEQCGATAHTVPFHHPLQSAPSAY